MRLPKRFVAASICAAALMCEPAACADNNTTAASGAARGTIVSTTPVAQLSTEDTAAYLGKGNFGTPVRNGINAYRVVYRTITPEGGPTTASGLVVLPRTGSRQLRLVAYEHGTLTLKSDAPSVNGQTRPDQARTIRFAAAGYAAAAPITWALVRGPGITPTPTPRRRPVPPRTYSALRGPLRRNKIVSSTATSWLPASPKR